MDSSQEINGFSMTRCKLHTDGEHHNCLYVERRNSLIPKASELAKERVKVLDPMRSLVRDSVEYGNVWSREFHRAMNELAVAVGLVRPVPRDA